MKKYFFISAIIFSICLFLLLGMTTFSSKKKTENKYWPNGKLKSSIELLNGKKNGWEILWNESGEMISRSVYIDNEKCGISQIFINGKLKHEQIYLNDTTIIVYRKYNDANGSLEVEEIDNLKHKVKKGWYPAQIEFTSQYIDEIEIGEWKWYYQSGRQKVSGMYDSVEIGKEYPYIYEDIQSNGGSSITFIHRNVKNGSWKYYSEEGELTKEEIWDKGKLVETKNYQTDTLPKK